MAAEKIDNGKIDQLILKIPAKRWFAIRRALDMPTGEILEDPLAQLVVAANESHRKETGKDDWSRFLDLNIEELAELVGVTSADDPKSDVDGGGVEPDDGAAVGSAVGVAGGGAGVPAVPGAVVSGDGPLD